jgi:hypothetical protein
MHGEVPDLPVVPLCADFDPVTLSLSPSLQPSSKMNTLLIKLLKHMGVTVADDADETAITAAVEKACAKDPAALSAAAMAAIDAKLAVVTALNAKIEKLEAADAGRAISAQRDAAIAAGKLVALSAEQLLKLGAADAAAYLDGLKAGEVPMSARTVTGLSATQSSGAPSGDEAQALRDLGIDPSSLK